MARLAWGRERRVCQAVRVALGSGGTALVANLHATSFPADPRLPDAELFRAATFADALARPDEPVVLCGDFNVSRRRSATLRQLEDAEWGFSKAGSGIDHIVVRGIGVRAGPTRWQADRRQYAGRLLSDHAPVDAELA